jgi:hypothetical protein
MVDKDLKGLFAGFGAILGVFGIVLQFFLTYEDKTLGAALIRFFSYFTILTNIVVIIYFLAHTFRFNPRHRFIAKLVSGLKFPEASSAITVYIVIVGLVYQLILSKPLSGWVIVSDGILHAVIPIFFTIYWIVFTSNQRVNVATIPYWLIYPFIYFLYTLVRGELTGLYPYPFIDVSELGYPKVLFNCFVVAIVFLVLSISLAAIANWRNQLKSS